MRRFGPGANEGRRAEIKRYGTIPSFWLLWSRALSIPHSLDLQVMVIAERLFLPPSKENAESDKKVGVRVSRRILKQQQERIAAEKLEGMGVVIS